MTPGARRRHQWAAWLLSVSLVGLASTAFATDYYVDEHTGNDSNEGSAQHPFRTLLPLLQRLTPCDNAYVRIAGAANGTGVGRYSHAESPDSAACAAVNRKS